ncbi:hypothetical protein SD3246_0555 [Salmonella enterica subsp. enterica serovar Dublin str. SD3246]|uniref:Uncharacterized protein n=1 Tax=Salmonella enterica subsp. enterica serovar Dublin str. SD3246 TaxID=909945 RepID=A0A8X6JXU3_SALDU|nr:hypothetical protein SD3246_0555 [Salmonella enterica subsp. enterica serovar Dublin str. SD3246]
MKSGQQGRGNHNRVTENKEKPLKAGQHTFAVNNREHIHTLK